MFIVIETFGGADSAIICTDTTGENGNIVFDTEKEAQEYADEFCQKGIVIHIP